jgi:hypothetical protein
MSRVFYGLNEDEKVDVTEIAMEKCMEDIILVIPISDPIRAEIFGDPYVGQLKKIFIVKIDGTYVVYDHETEVCIDHFE